MKKIPNVIGELLWNVLPEGKKLSKESCNFVCHAQKQGAKAVALSAVVYDDNKKEILDSLKKKNVLSELIQIHTKPTSTVEVPAFVCTQDGAIPQYY